MEGGTVESSEARPHAGTTCLDTLRQKTADRQWT